jgi:hypothetical protein
MCWGEWRIGTAALAAANKGMNIFAFFYSFPAISYILQTNKFKLH